MSELHEVQGAPYGPMAVDDLANLIASFVSAGVKDDVLVNGS